MTLERISNTLRGYFARRLPPDYVDDAVQDVMVLLLAEPGEIRCLSAYAIGIARHYRAGVIRDLCRDRGRYAGLEHVPVAAAATEDAADDRSRLVESLLSQLSPLRSAILRRFYLDDLSAKQVCLELGISLAQFGNENRRAKLKLRCSQRLVNES